MKQITKRKAASDSAKKRESTLDDLLDEYGVGQVDLDHIACNPGVKGLKGWWWVCDDVGVYAYFAQEHQAFRWRLAEINRRLNG